MSAGKKRKMNPDEKGEGSSKEDIETVQTVILNEERSAFTDIIICTIKSDKEKSNGKTTKFEVEKAILACHSTLFLNMFTDCSTSSKEEVAEISIPEPAKIVSSFLHIIYGTFQECKGIGNDKESFDHWVDVIAMGDKYFAKVVIDKSIFHLCKSFGLMSSRSALQGNNIFSHTRFGEAVFLKLIVVFSEVENGDLLASQFAEKELKLTIRGYWIDFCSKCGIDAKKITKEKKNQSLCKLEELLPKKAVGLFDARDIFAFQKFIEDIPQEDFQIITVLTRHFVKKA